MKILQRLEHKNILKLEDFFETKESVYFVLDYIENGSLTSVMKKFGEFPGTLSLPFYPRHINILSVEVAFRSKI